MMKRIGIAVMTFFVVFGVTFYPVISVRAQTEDQSGAETVPDYTNQDFESKLSNDCKILSGQIAGCVLWLYYIILYYPSNWFAYITGSLFDYFVAYSLSTGSYSGTNNQFVERGWSVIRDISNIFFIFSLLWIAIMHILQAGGSNTKKFLKNIIVAALLINFSLFFTKVIIDAGNILARAFYNNIDITNDDNPDFKTLSQGIVQYVSPQKIMTSDFFQPTVASGRAPSEINSGWVFLIITVALIINVVLGITFLSVFLLFGARVIGLWFMMIFSPLALASTALPGGKNLLGRFGFDKWLSETISLSFMAPVFMFFLFLLIMFLDIAFTGSTPFNEQSTVQKFMGILVPFIAIIVMLGQAKSMAKKMSGEIGQQATNWAGKAIGFAGGAALGFATGGIGMVGRNTLGAIGRGVSQKKWTQRWAAKSRVGRTFQRAAIGASNSSFDFRNTGAGKRTSALLNQTLAAANLGKIDMGKGTTKGGYLQRFEARRKAMAKDEELVLSDDQTEFNVTYKDRNGQEKSINTSKQDAEIAYNKAQNEAKRRSSTRTLRDYDGTYKDFTGDYNTYTKQKEATDKKKTEAETTYAQAQRNARRNADGSIDMTDPSIVAAKAALDYAKERQEKLKLIIKDIESEYKVEESIFNKVKATQTATDAKSLRNLAESINPTGEGWNKVKRGMNWVYDAARGENPGVRKAASKNIALDAEKEDRKAQAEEKKT